MEALLGGAIQLLQGLGPAIVLIPLMAKRGPKPKGPLDSEHRRTMLRIISQKPGISIVALKNHFPFEWGSFYYHLRMLMHAGYLRVETDTIDLRRRHVFPVMDREKMTAAGLSTETRLREPAKQVALLIMMNPGLNLKELAELADMPERTLYYHVKRLVDAGLVQPGSSTRYIDLVARPMLYELLRIPQPGKAIRAIKA